jgi:hypothetical protein
VSAGLPRVTLQERILRNCSMVPEVGCWLWMGSINNSGYGTISHWMGRGGVAAHRAAYMAFVGVIPTRMVIDHLCGHRWCVNPAHLEVVTQSTNLLRADTVAAHHAAKTHCPYGHAYSESNTHLYRGQRNCRACWRRKNKQAYQRRKQEKS